MGETFEPAERIWAYTNGRGLRVWTPMKPAIVGAHEEQEYVRADIYAALARQAEALQRENAELREALRPFAECAPEWESEPDSLHVFLEWNDEKAPVPSLPVADFRRARALIGGENAGN